MRFLFKILLFCFIFLQTTPLFSHSQHVHQYIVIQAYNLLIQSLGDTISEMNSHIGGEESYYAGEKAWQIPFVTTGAWREDIEDVIFNYKNYSFLNDYALISISHFWDADDGDFEKNIFRVNPSPLPAQNIGPYENAFDKFTRYADGNWILHFPDSLVVENLANGHILTITSISIFIAPPGIPLTYNGLIDFYHNRTVRLNPEGGEIIQIYDANEDKYIPVEDVGDIKLSPSARDKIAWEVLGRMCHLLGDMSVPAHAHRDEHGLDPDSYESWMGSADSPYQVWSSEMFSDFLNPYNEDNDPLHYLMYTTQQISDHFGSNGPYEGDGNNVLGGSPRPEEIKYFNTYELADLGEPSTINGPWTNEVMENIRDKTFPHVIRATAGLLYWFAVETGMYNPLVAVEDDQTEPVAEYGFKLYQNYPNPFNPSTNITFEIPQSSNVTLKVYNMLGELVATLTDEIRSEGIHKLKFDSNGLASGFYLYRLIAGDYSFTRRMMLVK